MRHKGPAPADSIGTMARMYVRVKGRSTKNRTPQQASQRIENRIENVLDSMPDAETRAIAEVLLGGRPENYQGAPTGSAVGGQGYVDFLLQQADHSTNEKFSVTEVLSDNYVSFFFGQQAPVFTYRGMLMNTFQDDWAMNMNRLFRSIARGTQLARRGLLLYLRYDSVLVSGVLTALNTTHRAESETGVPFSFQMLVKKMHIMNGALAPPTAIPAGDPFIDPEYVLAETVVKNVAPLVKAPTGKEDALQLLPTPEVPKEPAGTKTKASPKKKVKKKKNPPKGAAFEAERAAEAAALEAEFGIAPEEGA